MVDSLYISICFCCFKLKIKNVAFCLQLLTWPRFIVWPDNDLGCPDDYRVSISRPNQWSNQQGQLLAHRPSRRSVWQAASKAAHSPPWGSWDWHPGRKSTPCWDRDCRSPCCCQTDNTFGLLRNDHPDDTGSAHTPVWTSPCTAQAFLPPYTGLAYMLDSRHRFRGNIWPLGVRITRQQVMLVIINH